MALLPEAEKHLLAPGLNHSTGGMGAIKGVVVHVIVSVFSCVESVMLWLRQHLKIAQIVVRPVAVDVMDVLVGRETAAEVSLHHGSVLEHAPAIDGDVAVPLAVTAASPVRVLPSLGLAWITVLALPLVVKLTQPIGVTRGAAHLTRTDNVMLRGHQGVAVLAPTLQVLVAPTSALVASLALINRACVHHHSPVDLIQRCNSTRHVGSP